MEESQPQKPEKEINIKIIVDSPLKTPSKNNSPCIKHVCDPIDHKVSPKTNMNSILSPGRSPIMRVRTEDIRNCKNKRAAGEVIMTDQEGNNNNNINDGEDQQEREQVLPNPYKAAAASALAFLCGSVVPLASAIFVAPNTLRVIVVVVVSSLALVVFGGVGAHLGGSPVKVSAVRVLIGGWIAMGITYGLLKPFDKDKDMGVES